MTHLDQFHVHTGFILTFSKSYLHSCFPNIVCTPFQGGFVLIAMMKTMPTMVMKRVTL